MRGTAGPVAIEWNVPDDREMLPKDQAEHLDRVFAGTKYSGLSPSDAVRGILVDLRHYCDQNRLGYGELDRDAHDSYLEEIATPALVREYAGLIGDARLGQEKRLRYLNTLAAMGEARRDPSGEAWEGVRAALIEATECGEPALRQGAAEALGKMRPTSKEATKALDTLALTDDDWRVRRSACEALGRIGGKSAINTLGAVVRADDEPDVRKAAQTARKELLKKSHVLAANPFLKRDSGERSR